MKIYSWNMYYLNPDLDRAFSFIADLDFDVLCLQEVPEGFLERLKSLPYSLAFGMDMDLLQKSDVLHTYCAILSRRAIKTEKEFLFPAPPWPIRTRLFKSFMQLFGGWRRITKSGSMFVDLETGGAKLIRVFCLHLKLSYPTLRSREFKLAMGHSDPSIPTMICGDLNVLESPRVTLLNWLLGGPLRDIFAWSSERHTIEQSFSEHGLQNPLRGTRTQNISRSQLDHILVPKNLRVLQAKVMPDPHGSDHHPIFVECE